MGSRLKITVLTATILLGVHLAARPQQNPYRLKEPDQKKLCLTCHTDFEQTLKKRFVHTAVRTGDCSGCHNPHVSSHGKLLSDDTNRLCAQCHDTMIPANATSAHKIVADGQCVKCHDPHASDNAANLVESGNALCTTCHTDVGVAVQNATFKHNPVERNCLSCHGPHGSDKSLHLLKSEVPALCLTCHKTDAPSFVKQHRMYPVAKGSCTSCHNPHGSETSALLYANVHPPVANGMCAQCHEAPDSPSPFATKRPGYELCRGCHDDMVNTTMAKGRLHWPVADQKGCVNCHNPHAAKHERLLKADSMELCGSCHADALKRLAATAVKHAPVESGMCVDCHSPHAADGTYLVDQPSIIELCGACHDYEQHSAHPIGEEVVDPRNNNLRVQCLSCHKGHGTEFQWTLLAATNVELCTRCHMQFAR